MLHNPMSTGSVQNDLLLVAALSIGLLMLVYALAKAQAYIDKRVTRKLKEESHARYLAKMSGFEQEASKNKKQGKSAPVAVELHDEAIAQKIEQLRQDKPHKKR